MDNKDLLEEIRMVREDIKELRSEFFLFKGKAFGFIAAMSAFFGFFIDHVKHKFFH